MSSRKVPYGYKLDSLGRKIEDPETMPHLERIIDAFVYDYITSPAMLARILNAEGVPTQRGGKWHASTVDKLLQANEEKIKEAQFRKGIENARTPREPFTMPDVMELELERGYEDEDGNTTTVKTEVYTYTKESVDLGHLRARTTDYFKKSKLFHAERAVFFDVLNYDENDAEEEVKYLGSLLSRVSDEQVRADLSRWIDTTIKRAGQLAQMARFALADREEMKREHATKLVNYELWQRLVAEHELALDAKTKPAKRLKA